MNPSFPGRCLRFATALFVLLVLLAVGLLIYLKTAPPPLDFLKETIESHAARTLPGVRIRIGGIRLVWPFWRLDPQIRLTDLVISDPRRPAARLADCDRADITLSVTDLLRQRIVPNGIALIRPRLDLANTARFAGPFQPPTAGNDARLPTVRIEDGRVLPRTEGAPSITIPEARLIPTAEGLRLTLSAVRAGKTVDVDARRQQAETGGTQWDIAFVGLQPPMLATLSDAFAHLDGIRLPIKGRCLARRDETGRLVRAELQITGAAGTLSYPWLERDLPVNALSATLTWAAPGAFFLESGKIDFEGPTFHVTGPFDWENGRPTLALSVTATDIDIADLSSYWPPPAEPEVRQWLVDHFIAGNAHTAEATLWLTPDDFDRCQLTCGALSATVDFSDLVLDYFPPMPRLRAASGRAVFSGCGVEIAVESGRADNSRVVGGAVRIIGFADHPTQMEIDARVDGPAADVFTAVSDLELEDWAPLFRVTGGRADTRLGFRFPLQDEFDPDAFKVDVEAEGKALDLETAWGLPLTDGAASVHYADGKLEVHGTARLDGVPLSINWEQDRLNGPGKDTVLTVTGAPNRKAFAAWGIPLPEGVDEPVPATVHLKITEGETRAAARFDLSGATLAAPLLGWRKSPGENAALALDLGWRSSDTIRVDKVHFYGTDFQVMGSGVVRPQTRGLAWRFDLETVHLEAHRLSATIEYDAEGVKAEIHGPLFNAMPLLDPKTGRAASDMRSGGIPLDIHLAIDRILLKNGVELRQAIGRFQQDRNGIPSLFLQGVTGPEGAMELTLVPVKTGQRLLVRAADAGTLANGLDLYRHASGGRLSADFLIQPQSPFRADGVLSVTGFTLREAPTLVAILSLASFDGLVNGLRQDGTPFDDLHASVSISDGVMTLREGKMEGDALGVTFSGRYDLNGRQMDIDGIVVPFNLLNKVVNAVPLVGKMITGDGIIAVNYRLTGSPTAPHIRINPISSLLVGRLRDLFDRIGPGGDTD